MPVRFGLAGCYIRGWCGCNNDVIRVDVLWAVLVGANIKFFYDVVGHFVFLCALCVVFCVRRHRKLLVGVVVECGQQAVLVEIIYHRVYLPEGL